MKLLMRFDVSVGTHCLAGCTGYMQNSSCHLHSSWQFFPADRRTWSSATGSGCNKSMSVARPECTNCTIVAYKTRKKGGEGLITDRALCVCYKRSGMFFVL